MHGFINPGKTKQYGWEAYYDNGREHSGVDVIEWAKRGQELGAGEILLTSVDQEGTGKGLDVELIKSITDTVSIPVIASGGMGTLQHMQEAIVDGAADAIAMAHVLHYDKYTLSEIRQHALEEGLPVRITDKDGRS